MFLVLSKTLDLFLAPLTWALLLLFASLALRGRAAWALPLGLSGLLVLLAFSNERVAEALERRAERGVRSTQRPDVTYDAVILLSGALDGEQTKSSGMPEYNEAAERVMRTFELLREGRARFALISGVAFEGQAPAEPTVVARQLERWGIDRSRIVEEKASRNTRENAVESAKIVARRGWKQVLLVTSAAHMPRALGCFHAAGVFPDTEPVDHHGAALEGGGFAPRALFLEKSTAALRELAGRVVYRLAGYSQP